MTSPVISAIIATFNRRDLVVGAIRSVLEQTQRVEQVIVVDDGSSDGTGAALARQFGGRIDYLWQENAGVSAARNRGLALAQGRYLTFLDSDDRWHADKSRRQLAWLEAHPDYGMVLCDVVRVDGHGNQIDVLHRRSAIPEDGDVLRWVLQDPALVPASVMLRREVVDSIGGFDPGLATGEDLDFHLRVAREWKIGVIEQALVTAMRGHQGLSASAGTYADYVRVIERFAPSVTDRVPARCLDAALSVAWRRSARGLILEGRWQEALTYARRAWSRAPTMAARRGVLGLAPVAVRRLGGSLKQALRSRPG